MLSQGYLRTLCIATISLLSLLPTELAAKSGSPRPQHKLEDSIEAKPPGPALPGSKPSAGDSKGTPLDAIVVGPGGKYSTVQAGVTVAMQKCSSGGSVTISISAGTYREQVNIPGGSKCKLIIKGATSSDGHNAVTITYAGARQPYQKTATMFVGADDIAVYNLNVENTFGTGAQAVALFAQSARGRQAYYGCSFKGYQDTLFASAAQTYFRDCSITGAVDFIFGQAGNAWFEKCKIFVTSSGWVTASGRDSANGPGYIVLNACTIDGAGRAQACLGRPWGHYARAVVQNSQLGAVIKSAGWEKMGEDKPGAQMSEFGNKGEGAKGPRSSLGKKLSKPMTLSEVLGGDTSWIDSSNRGSRHT